MILQIGSRISFYTWLDMETNPYQLGYGIINDIIEGVRKDEYAVYYLILPDIPFDDPTLKNNLIKRDESEVNPDKRDYNTNSSVFP